MEISNDNFFSYYYENYIIGIGEVVAECMTCRWYGTSDLMLKENWPRCLQLKATRLYSSYDRKVGLWSLKRLVF